MRLLFAFTVVGSATSSLPQAQQTIAEANNEIPIKLSVSFFILERKVVEGAVEAPEILCDVGNDCAGA